VAVAWALGPLAPSCGGGGDVVALSGCLSKQKACLVDGQLTCVSAIDPEYGCNALPTDTHQCFSCGTLGFVHGTPTCNAVSGNCDIAACDDGYLKCPGQDPTHGCTTSINWDNSNCGACLVECTLGPNQTSNTCQMGKCTATCEPGYVSCAAGMVCDCGPNKACVNRVCT
jgi:hypothetical protein